MSSELVLATFISGIDNGKSDKKHESNKNNDNNSINSKEECTGHVWNIDTGLMLTSNVFREMGKSISLINNPDNPHFQVGIASCNPILGCIYLHSLGKERPVIRSFGMGSIICVTASQGHLLAAGDSSGTIKVWDMTTGELIHIFQECHLQRINKVLFSRDGRLLISSSMDATINVFDLESKKIIYTFKEHGSSVNDIYLGIGIGKNARLLSGSSDKTCNLYDLVDGSLLASFSFPTVILAVTMNVMESVICVGGQNGICYFVDLNHISSSLRKDEHVTKVEVSREGEITSILYTSDEGKIVLSSTDNKITIIDSEFRIITRTLELSTGQFSNQKLAMIKLMAPKSNSLDSLADNGNINEKLEFKQLAKTIVSTDHQQQHHFQGNNSNDKNNVIKLCLLDGENKESSNTSHDLISKEYEKLKKDHEKLLQVHQKLLKTISK